MQVDVKIYILMKILRKPGRKIVFSYGLVRTCDMEANMKKFVMEMCVSCLEKYSDNSLVSEEETNQCNVHFFLQCAQIIKQKMDETFGGAGYWNVVVGEGFDVRIEREASQSSYHCLALID